jgi:hypothetical protein
VEVFVGPDAHAAFAYVFHMAGLGVGGYDEDKVAVGFATREDAERCLRAAYNRPGLFDSAPRRLTAPEQACKDANCTDPAHGHTPEAAKAHRGGLVLEHLARADGHEQGYWTRPRGPVFAGPMGGGGSSIVTADDIEAALGDWYRPPGGTISGGAGDVFGGAAEILGRPAQEIDLLAACGATHGDSVEATRYPGDEPPAIELVLNPTPPERGVQAIRWLKGDDGSPVIVNDVIMAFPPGQKLGLAAFASQVVNVERLGVRRIEAYAARGDTWVGFDVWHKMGYLPVDDAALVTEAIAAHRGVPIAVEGFSRLGFGPGSLPGLTALLSTQDGAAWWAKFGVGYQAAFDLNPGSTCMRTLHAYILSKKREANACNDPESAPTV